MPVQHLTVGIVAIKRKLTNPWVDSEWVPEAVLQGLPSVPPRTLIGAWREMRATWRKQQIDPAYQFDTPLPATAGRIAQTDQRALEQSIGDLAPEALAKP